MTFDVESIERSGQNICDSLILTQNSWQFLRIWTEGSEKGNKQYGTAGDAVVARLCRRQAEARDGGAATGL